MSLFDTSSPESLGLVALSDGKNFQVSDYLYRILSLIDGERSAQEIAMELSRQLGMDVSAQEVTWAIQEKLVPAGIVVSPDDRDQSPADSSLSSTGRSPLSLLARVPLLSPTMVRPFTAVGQYLFFAPFLVMSLVVGAIAHVNVYYQLTSIIPSLDLNQLFRHASPAVFFYVGVSAFVHELGHLSPCRRYACPHGSIGFGIYMVYPVLYADVTQSWRLPRPQRLMVDLGGVYFQLLLTELLFGLFILTHDQSLILAIVAVDAMVVSALNPMFKFDGYWALSDLIGVPNLHQRVADWVRGVLRLPGIRSSPFHLEQMPTPVRAAIGLYVLGCAGYFTYFAGMLAWLTPKILRSYPGLLMRSARQAWQSILTGNVSMAVGGIFELLFPTMLLLGLVLLLSRLLPFVGKAIHFLYAVAIERFRSRWRALR